MRCDVGLRCAALSLTCNQSTEPLTSLAAETDVLLAADVAYAKMLVLGSGVEPSVQTSEEKLNHYSRIAIDRLRTKT